MALGGVSAGGEGGLAVAVLVSAGLLVGGVAMLRCPSFGISTASITAEATSPMKSSST
jgi:hypothetical protein